MATGDPVICEKCKAVLNSDSVLKPIMGKESRLWKCEFCYSENEIFIDDEEIPKNNEVNYLVEAAAQIQDKKLGGNQDISVIFCIDISGSMCVTQAIQGKHQIKGDKHQQMQGLMVHSDGSDQYYNASDKNKTYISRMQCLKAAIQSQIEDMSHHANKRKVGVVTFNNEVTVIGDGCKAGQVITGDKLFDFEFLENNGKTQAASQLQQSIGESAKVLSEKIMAIEESGPTVMGPAVLTSIAMACQGNPGSTVVVCTDGLANVGLGAFDEAKTEMDKAKNDEFYERIGQLAQQNGVTVNIVSIEGAECNIESLSKLAELTGG